MKDPNRKGPGPRPILLLEMNEIPWRVIDRYRVDRRFPNLGRFFAKAETYTTETVDEGELSPWITWPSFHRGMGNEEHGIRNLGQDPRTFRGTPIWEEYRRRSLPIGVCGSMQSWPPMDPGQGGFYIPDTFAHDERCIPAIVEPFQRFNLDQVRRNGRVVKGDSRFGAGTGPLLKSLTRLGIRARSILDVGLQLVRERWNPAMRARRPIFQTVMLWDIFLKLYDVRKPPAFSSFFTNHVAGVMHRYWHHVFPEDFGRQYLMEARVHRATMEFAMVVADRIVGEAMDMAKENPEIILVFATSMGQAAVNRENHEGIEASVPELPKLMTVCGLSADQYVPLLAMVPQVAVEIPSLLSRNGVKAVLEAATTLSGKRLFRVEEIGDSLSITILTPSMADARSGAFLIGVGDARSHRRTAWDEAGIHMNEVEPGTAYHIPEGVLAVYREGEAGRDFRKQMKASDVKAYLMGLSGVNSVGEVSRFHNVATPSSVPQAYPGP